MARAWLGDVSSCCSTCFHTSSSPFSWLGLLCCPGALLGCTSGILSHTQLPQGFPDPSGPALGKETKGKKELGRAQHQPGVLLPPCPADLSPCAHLAGDVTWRLGRGENLLPAPVQRRGLSLRDIHSHRGHRFPGETTTAASLSPPSAHTLARTGCWGGGTGGFQPLYPQLSPNQQQVLAGTLPPLSGRAGTDRRARWYCCLFPLTQQTAQV